MGTVFTATISPVDLLIAILTVPDDPLPSSFPTMYCPVVSKSKLIKIHAAGQEKKAETHTRSNENGKGNEDTH